ncbi:MAG: hypothetical protein M3N21_03065 [Actinomycetota bacterium]|nr:hypothetical protein [Actinomycetota bacterium]
MRLRLALVASLAVVGVVGLGASPASADWSCGTGPHIGEYSGVWEMVLGVTEYELNHSAVADKGPCPIR